MRPVQKDPESWKRMVLRSMPRPAWLSADAPHADVVLSSRTRVMRNLAGHRFPHKAGTPELMEVMGRILEAAADLQLEAHRSLSNAERDYLVGCRLVSPEFEWTLPGRALLMDEANSISLMINEEDHIRLQALTAGWSFEHASGLAQECHDRLASRLDFAFSPDFGYLASSPFNCGLGRRQSSMFHLIGLAQGKRLPHVMRALSARGIAVRGLFGESSRAVGAFVQVSVIGGSKEDFVGACEYLIDEERKARGEIGSEALAERAYRASEFVQGSRSLSLADALRALAWVRWAALAQVDGFDFPPREVDAALTTLEIRAVGQQEDAARGRAESLKHLLGV